MATINDNYEQIINEFGNKIEGFDTDIKDIDSKKATNVDLETERVRIDKHDLDIKDINDKKATKEEVEVERARINDINSQLGQTETKNTEQDSRLDKAEYVNKRQETLMKGLLSENSDGRLSIDGEGNHIKLEGSKDGVIEVKKAVGNTLVNLLDYSGVYSQSGYKYSNGIITLTSSGSWGIAKFKLPLIKPNTDYTLIIYVYENTTANSKILIIDNDLDTSYFTSRYQNIVGNGLFKKKFTSKDGELTSCNLGMRLDDNTNGVYAKFSYIILEGDYTNKPIPNESFEGMKSCFEDKLIDDSSNPHNGKYEAEIKVVGKNKVDMNFIIQDENYLPCYIMAWKYLPIYVGGERAYVKRTYKDNITDYKMAIVSNDKYNGMNRTWLPLVHSNYTDKEYYGSIPTDNGYVYILLSSDVQEIFNVIESLTISSNEITSHIPYKEHVQTLYLDEPLYANNELCVHEGALGYWKNYKKVVFNGSEDWAIYTVMSGTNVITIGFGINLSDIKKIENLNVTHGISCDILPVITQTLMWKTDCEGISISNNQNIRVRVLRIKAQTLSEFKTYLKNNPISFLYPLEEPVFVPILDETPKWVLESFNECSVYFDTNIPISNSSFTYTGNVPSVYRLEETGVTNTKDISDTQVAVDYLLMNSKDPMSTNLFTRKGMCNMGAYFASRIMKGFLDYGEVIRKYPEFKDDIDFILRSEGREDLIK